MFAHPAVLPNVSNTISGNISHRNRRLTEEAALIPVVATLRKI